MENFEIPSRKCDRLLEINSHPLPSYQKATDLLRNGPDLVKLRLQRKARHESSTASPTCRRHKRRLHHQLSPESDEDAMGSNVSRHSEKGLSGRRTQSSGNLCNGNKLLAPNVARILVPCTGVGPKDRNKFCGSLPNHLDGKPSPGDSGDTPESCCNGNNNNDEYLQRFQGDYLTMAAPSSSSSAAAQHQQHNQHHHQQTKNKRNELELRLHPLDPSVLYDQGYGSERSPEEEHPLKAPQPDVCQGRPLEYPFITPESTFEACVLKGSRGLGLSVTGGVDTKEQWPGLIRIKRLFPHQPAWQTGQLSQGDILLAANGVALSGLSNYQALEVLRKTPSSVVLTVCRPPSDVFSDPPPSEPPPPPRRDPAHSITGRTAILPLPPLQTEGPTGEFDIHLTKVNHSLGFTLRKEDESVLGHYVRALVREPALSDGRIRPGDKIVAVNDVDISPMSHEEAVMFLRQCGDHVKLRLYRDAAQTPVSALSPTEESKLFRPKPILRKEAMDMLCDLAVRKLSPGDNSTGSSSYTRLRRVSDGQSSSSPSSSPRRRKLTKTPSPDAQPLTQERIAQKYLVSSHVGNSDSSGEGSNTNTCTYQSSFDSTAARGRGSSFASSEEGGGPELRPQRPNFLDLCGASSLPGTARKQRFTFSTDGEEEGSLCHTGSDEPDTLGSVSRLCPSDDEAADRCDLPLEPTSMPPLTNLSSTSSTSTAFSYRNPAYQSACPAMRGKVVEEVHEHASDQDIPGKVFGSCPGGAEGTRGLLKWKGVVFTPESDPAEEDVIDEGETIKSTGECLKQKQREGQVFMVELTRGWNSRLGFSLQSDGSDTYISAIYADSVAAKDGRLRAGDQVIMVNDEDITNMTTSDLIDLLRKIRGTIGITVLRKTGPRPQAS